MGILHCSLLVSQDRFGDFEIRWRPFARVRDEPSEPFVVEIVGHDPIVPDSERAQLERTRVRATSSPDLA